MEADELNKKIKEVASNWKTPFEPGSEIAAKERLMAMARNSQTPIEAERDSKLWIRVAAALIILVLIPMVLITLGQKQQINNSDELMVINLPCDSKVDLSPGSSVKYNSVLWTFQRKLQFDGQAHFDVEAGSTFTVDGESGDIRVLGTKFTVWSDPNDLFVHCGSGKVEVISPKDKEILVPGTFTKLDGSKLEPVQSLERTGFIAPRKGVLEYDQISIGVVISELELALDCEIDYTLDPTLKYSGTLNTSSADSCLKVFCKPFNANFVKDQDFVSIYP